MSVGGHCGDSARRTDMALNVENITEHRLGNGLLILLKQNRVAPIISLSIAYRVGSKHERPGITGISHLLEHGMFKGTHKHPTGEFDRLLTLIGADNNAYTWVDKTVYYEIVPADKIELALELEADRMRNLAFDAEEHASEVVVVRNELEQSDDSPPALLYKSLRATAFVAHPYAIPTIGWSSDVERMTVDQVREYYDRHYRPDNALVVAVGDFEPDEMLASIEKHFAAIPSGGDVISRIPCEPPQQGQRRLILRRTGNNDYLLIGWHAPSSRHPDAYALDVLANVLGGGRTCRLYQRLVESGRAGAVGASSGCFTHCDPFLFLVSVALNEGTALEDAEKSAIEEIERIAAEGVAEQELKRAKKQARAGFVYSRDSVEDEADAILTFELASSYRDIDCYLPGIEAVSDEDVRRVAGHYLTTDNSTVGYYQGVRSGESTGAADGSSMASMAEPPHRSAAMAGRPAASDAPRGRAPLDAENVVERRLPNGMLVLVKESHYNSTVAISGRIRCGSVFEPEGKAGLAYMTARMLSEGTKARAKLQIAELLEDNGMGLSFQANREYVAFGGRCLAEDVRKLVGLLAEELMQPAFPQEQVDRVRAHTLNTISRMEDDTFERAYRHGRTMLYGLDHPYGTPVSGRTETVQTITRQEMVDFHSLYAVPEGAVLSIAGDMDSGQMIDLITGKLGEWSGGVVNDEPLYMRSRDTRKLDRDQVKLEMPGRSNATILVMRPGITRLAPDYYAAAVANYIFGGDFASRLNDRLRAVAGLTYGSYSFTGAGRGSGPWVIYIQVNPDNVEQATDLALAEWRRMYDEGATELELNRAKSYLTGNFVVRLNNIGAIASAFAEIAHYDLGIDYFQRYQQIVNGLTLEEVNAAFRSNFAPDGYVVIIAGNV